VADIAAGPLVAARNMPDILLHRAAAAWNPLFVGRDSAKNKIKIIISVPDP
jgi:hypothetical protein